MLKDSTWPQNSHHGIITRAAQMFVGLYCLCGWISKSANHISEVLSPKISMCIVHSDWFPVINSMLGKYLHVHPKLYKKDTRSMTIWLFATMRSCMALNNHYIYVYVIHIKCCNEDLEPCSFFNRSRSIQLMQQTFTSENHYANHSSLRQKVSKCKCDRSSSINKESHHRTSDIWKYDHKIHKETRRMDGWHLQTSIFATRKLAQSTHDLILLSRWNKGQMWDRTRSDYCNMLRSWGI